MTINVLYLKNYQRQGIATRLIHVRKRRQLKRWSPRLRRKREQISVNVVEKSEVENLASLGGENLFVGRVHGQTYTSVCWEFLCVQMLRYECAYRLACVYIYIYR